MSEAVIRVEDLDVYYGTSQILFGVALSVRQGETMALLGRNGAGKSTTMKAIMGLAPARRGSVKLRGQVAILHVVERGSQSSRFGIALTRRVVKSSVERNRVKRVLREAFRRHRQ